MCAEDPLEELAGSVLDGSPVDWDLAETRTTGAGEEATLRGLRDLERIAGYSRSLQLLTGPRSVTPPEQWGHLTLLEFANAGKTGEIWRAWDAWLQREVALKFLLAASEEADDSVLLDEARALARVRHSGVVAVYGIGEHAGRIGMWMELLVGNTLEVEIARRGPLPPREVARIGLELCRALEAVGTAGLVHRDIKPANIVLESSGRTVLTDFGLGQRLTSTDREPWRASGTPVFMSRERLAGEPATPRDDLYALGVTLRWALTGRCPFRARTLEDLKVEVDAGPPQRLRAERPDAPAALVEAIERAMAPRIEARHASASQMAEELELALGDAGPEGRRRTLWRRFAAPVAAILALGAAVPLILMLAGGAPSIPSARFSIPAPPHTTFMSAGEELAVSPDGRLLTFSALDSTGTSLLWLRPLGALAARPLEGTENAITPFWSPDSRYVAFFADSKLKKIPVSGGSPEVICPALDPRGGTWGKDGVIVFAPGVAGPLCRVSAEGGAVTVIQRPDSTRQETALRWPQFLPDGKRFFFVTLPPREGTFDVFVASPDSRERRRVMSAGCAPICAGTMGIVHASNGRLMFQKFDYRNLRPIGAPLSLGIAPFSDQSVGQPLASASMNGVLFHASETLANTSLVWLDRSGQPLGELALPPGRYEKVFIAPDERRLLVEKRDSPTTVDLWIVDRIEGEIRRFTQSSQSRLGGKPVWSPDGRRIAFNSNRSGRTHIYERLVDEARDEKLLYQSEGQFNEVLAWSPDGRYLVFQKAEAATGWDLWVLPLDGKREPIPYLQSRFNEYAATISPDGRWLAYTTDATGRPEVHVRSFPQPGVEHVATTIPGQAFWTKGGDLLVGAWQGMWSVPVSTAPTFRAEVPRLLFRLQRNVAWVMPTPSGDRFLASRPAADSEPTTLTVQLDFLADRKAGSPPLRPATFRP